MWMRATMGAALLSIALAAPADAQAARPAATRTSLEFGGGRLVDYVRLVREGTNANIVIDGDTVGRTILPAVTLGRVSVPQALQWLTTTAAARARGIVLQPTRTAGDSAEVFVLTIAQAPVPRSEPRPDTISKDYPLDSILNRPNWRDSLLASVNSKLSHRGSATGKAELVAGGRLLRVTGLQRDIRDADQTMDAMERSLRTSAAMPQLQAEVGRLRTQVDSLRFQLAELLRRLPAVDPAARR